MRSFRARYAALFARADVLRFAALSLPMRMPIGTVGLGTLLHLRELTGSIAFAGSIVGAQFVAMAATSPILGRIADRRGPLEQSLENRPSRAVTDGVHDRCVSIHLP